MSKVYVRKNETLDDAIARFKKQSNSVLTDCRQQMAFRSKKQIERAEAWERNKKRVKRQK